MLADCGRVGSFWNSYRSCIEGVVGKCDDEFLSDVYATRSDLYIEQDSGITVRQRHSLSIQNFKVRIILFGTLFVSAKKRSSSFIESGGWWDFIGGYMHIDGDTRSREDDICRIGIDN